MKKNTEYFMSLLEEIKEQKDDILLFFVSDVSRLSIGHVNNVAKTEHHRLVNKLRMEQSDYREELFELLNVQEIGRKALVSAVNSVNRYLKSVGKEVLCGEDDMDISEFAINLVNEYYS